MKRESMTACASLVGQARALCSVGHGDVAVELLDEALELLNEAPTKKREDDRARQQKVRDKRKTAGASRVTKRDGESVTPKPVVVGVVEVGVVGVEVEAEGVGAGGEVDAVYQHWRSYHRQGAAKTLSSKRKEYKLLASALKDFSVQQLQDCIDGYHASPWHNGVNDKGTKYLSLSLIFRDLDHITKGIEFHLNPDPVGYSEKTKRTAFTGRAWADDRSTS